MNIYKKIAQEVTEQYKNRPELIGIIWIGSSTYGIKDKYVDIDVRLLINGDKKSYPMKQKVIKGVTIEIEEISWQWLIADLNPDSERYWIRSKAIILQDSSDVIKNTFLELDNKIKSAWSKQLWNIYKDVIKDYEISKCIDRGEFESATMYIYESINTLFKFLFVYNNKPVPTYKWRWYFLKKSRYFSRTNLEKIRKILLSTIPLKSKLQLLKQIGGKVQTMMINKGYDTKMVKEYWRY